MTTEHTDTTVPTRPQPVGFIRVARKTSPFRARMDSADGVAVTEHIDTTTPACSRFVKIIRFHGMDLAVLNADGIDYIPARPLCDLANVNWRTAKRALESGDHVRLFAAKRLIPPNIVGLNSGLTPETGGGAGLKARALDEILCLRLDRSQMYLARISTDRMRANGNHDGADQLLALQIEWAKVLHDYETHGLAIKPGRGNTARDLLQWVRLRNQLTNVNDRHVVDQLIHDELAALGQAADALENEQLPLPWSSTDA